MNIRLFLPWPPSINAYYIQSRAHARGKPSPKIHSGAARTYHKKLEIAIHEQIPEITLEPLSDKLRLVSVLHPPDRRIRDIDNYVKPMLDSLTMSNVWEDDKLVDQHENYRGIVTKFGMVRLAITLAGPILPADYWPD